MQGDQIVKAEFLPAEDDAAKPVEEGKEKPTLPDAIEFSIEKPNWPFFDCLLQSVPPGTRVRLTLSDQRMAEMSPEDAKEEFIADRGFINQAEVMTIQTHSLRRGPGGRRDRYA